MPENPTLSRWTDSWSPQVNLDTPAGRVLVDLVKCVPEGTKITLFGSAPLQVCLAPTFISEDIDCFSPLDLADIVHKNGLGEGVRSPYVQVCYDLNFRTSPRWLGRAATIPLEGRILILPHPIDILIGKLHRLEPKDLKAFHLVRDVTGHPTESELIEELQAAVDLFRPAFDEEAGGDLKITTRILWKEFFGRDINVRDEIIAPALRLRELGYSPDRPKTDYKSRL